MWSAAKMPFNMIVALLILTLHTGHSLKHRIEYKVKESTNPAVRMAFDVILDGVRARLWFTDPEEAALFKLKWG